MITVRELIEELQKLDPDRVVILQADGEGNGYSPLSWYDDNAAYSADSTWSGEVGLQQAVDGYGEDDLAPEDAVPCVVLYPVN